MTNLPIKINDKQKYFFRVRTTYNYYLICVLAKTQILAAREVDKMFRDKDDYVEFLMVDYFREFEV